MNGKRRRRAHGEGSVYQRTSDKKWCAALDLGYVNGKRRRIVVYGETEQAALTERNRLKNELQLGVDLKAPPRTVAMWLREWLHDIKSADTTETSTLDRYRIAIETHLIPGLGAIPLGKLSVRDVQRFFSGLKGKYKPWSVPRPTVGV